MKRYGIVNAATGLVDKIILTSDPRMVTMNCPTGCAPDEVDDSVQAGYRKMGGKFYPPVTVAFSLEDMLATIDAERDARTQAALTAGFTKSYEYAEKAREYREITAMGILAALGAQTRFPWIVAEMAETGDTMQTVVTRIGTGMTNSALAPKIAARAQKLKRQLRAATDTASRQTIFLSRTWPT